MMSGQGNNFTAKANLCHPSTIYTGTCRSEREGYSFTCECFILGGLYSNMGNCLLGGMGGGDQENETIQVVTANGGIMEFHAPITVGFLLEEFPCHAVFKSDDLFWQPLSNHEELHPGNSYLLLPLSMKRDAAFEVKLGHVRSKSIPTCNTEGLSLYRMSFDSSCQSNVLKRSNTENVFSRYSKRGGVWKVKLAISREQLVDILSQEARTQELIESVRTVAKCGNFGASSLGFSDQLSIASSRASSKKDLNPN